MSNRLRPAPSPLLSFLVLGQERSEPGSGRLGWPTAPHTPNPPTIHRPPRLSSRVRIGGFPALLRRLGPPRQLGSQSPGPARGWGQACVRPAPGAGELDTSQGKEKKKQTQLNQTKTTPTDLPTFLCREIVGGVEKGRVSRTPTRPPPPAHAPTHPAAP